jgi:hypothetical protein
LTNFNPGLKVVSSNAFPDWTIDVTMKKNSCGGATSWYHCVAEDSRIPKMPAINPPQALIQPQTQETILNGLSIPNPNFSEFASEFGK